VTDTYIDADEIQFYGPYASRQIRTVVVGLQPEADGYMNFLADTIDASTTTVKSTIDASREASAGVRRGSKSKKPIKRKVSDGLSRFSKHLDSHPAGTIDRKVFFTYNGTVKGVGTSAHNLLQGVVQLTTELAKPTCPVRERETWLAELRELQGAFGPAVEHSDNAHTARADLTPEVAAGRLGWLNSYNSAKRGVESVLRLTGKLHLMKHVFYDLAVPANTKLTSIPEPPPAEPE
jgi:hypothetical protein